MDQAQKILDERRNKMREKKLQKLREYSNPNAEFHKKVTFIEGNIEKDILYYGDGKTVSHQIHNIKRLCRKISNIQTPKNNKKKKNFWIILNHIIISLVNKSIFK